MNVLFVIFSVFQLAYAVRITLFDDAWQSGASIDFSVGPNECSNFPAENFFARTTSIDTAGACLILCSERNCLGSCIKVSPGCGWPSGCCPQHGHLGVCQFNDKTASIQTC